MQKSNIRRAVSSTGLLAALAFALGCGGAHAQVAPPSLKTFFSRLALGSVALSPSGDTLAITAPGSRGRMELAVADLNQKPLKLRIVGWLPDYDIGDITWVNDRRMVFRAYDSQAGEWNRWRGLWAIDADGSNGQLLIDAQRGGYRLEHVPKSQNVLPGEWVLAGLPLDGSDDVLVMEYQWATGGRFKSVSLARLNTRKPSPVLLSAGAPEGVKQWIWDASGQPRWATSIVDRTMHIYQRANAQWTERASFDAMNVKWEPRFLMGDQLFASVPRAPDGAAQLALFDAKTGQPVAEPVLSAAGFDVGDNAEPLFDRAHNELLGWRYELDRTYTEWVNPLMKELQQRIDRAIPGHVNRIDCRNCLDARRWLVTSLSDREPPVYSIFERATGRLDTLGSAMPDYDPRAGGARTFHRIKARDGADLPVYVTHPAQRAAGPLPVVVYVHGGPEARVTLDFDPVPQFLASRGYLVVEPDFRGSTGYGTVHQRAAEGQWGLAMEDDLQDALQWAVAQKLADPDRACIMGASYGGYAALMGPIRHPGTYRCAISWVGVTDLPALLRDTHLPFTSNDLASIEDKVRIGDVDKDGEKLRQTSPVYRAVDIKVPVLAAWGKDDERVPLDQGRSFRDAAKKAGVDLEYVEYAGEGHIWLEPETRIDFFGRAEKLLAKTIGNQ